MQRARRFAMEYVAIPYVYTRVPRAHQQATGGQMMSTAWLDVNTGGSIENAYRYCLVGREFRIGTGNTLYSATPPLEALRAIVNYAATYSTGSQ